MNAVTELNVLAALERAQDPWLLMLPADVGFRLGVVATKQRQAGPVEPSSARPGGQSVTAPGRQGDRDPAHLAIMQVVSAARGVLRDDPPHLPTLVVPVIVVGSRLYAVSSDDDGGQEVVPISWERILWRGDRSGEPIAIDVVSRESLADYTELAAAGAAEFLPILRGAALDAREVEIQRQYLPGRAEKLVLGVESAWDASQHLAARARRFIGRLTR
jgi:hypothetical protein